MRVTSILRSKCSSGIHSQFSSSDCVFFFTLFFSHYTSGPIIFPQTSISVHCSRIPCTSSTVQLNAIRSTLMQPRVPQLLQYGHASPFAWLELFQKSTPLQSLSELSWKTVHVTTNIKVCLSLNKVVIFFPHSQRQIPNPMDLKSRALGDELGHLLLLGSGLRLTIRLNYSAEDIIEV